MTRSLPLLVVGVSLTALAGCGPGEVGDGAAPGEIEWGLGAKADGICDPAGDLCWQTQDLRALRTVERMALEAGLGEQPAAAALEEAVIQAESLAHKLTGDELARLSAIADEVHGGDGGEDRASALLGELHGDVLARTRGTYVAAYAVPTGRAADLEAGGEPGDGKFDDISAEPADTGAADGYSEGVRESLQMLRDAGLGGRAYAATLELSGALDVEYEVLDRDAMTPPAGPSRRERVDDVIGRYRLVAGGIGTGSGLVSMIPVAGIPLSIPLEAAGIMSVHTRMTLEIASIHGWDIRDGANLYIATMFLLSDGDLSAVTDDLAAAPSLPAIIRRLGESLGVPVTTTMSVRMAGSVTSYATRYLLRKFREAIQGAAAEQAAEGVAHQILGWATMGLSALVSGAADYVVTDRLGRHVEVVSRPWVIDIPVEGLEYLGDAGARACFASALAAVLRADGQVDDLEARYFATFLDKPYYAGGGAWYELSEQERQDLSAELSPSAAPDASCLGQFDGEDPIDKLTILSHLYAAAGVSGAFSPEALGVYRGAVDQLDGSGWFSGPSVKDYHIDYVEQAAEIALSPDAVDWPSSYQRDIEELEVDDMLAFLASPGADVLADVECALSGGC